MFSAGHRRRSRLHVLERDAAAYPSVVRLSPLTLDETTVEAFSILAQPRCRVDAPGVRQLAGSRGGAGASTSGTSRFRSNGLMLRSPTAGSTAWNGRNGGTQSRRSDGRSLEVTGLLQLCRAALASAQDATTSSDDSDDTSDFSDSDAESVVSHRTTSTTRSLPASRRSSRRNSPSRQHAGKKKKRATRRKHKQQADQTSSASTTPTSACADAFSPDSPRDAQEEDEDDAETVVVVLDDAPSAQDIMSREQERFATQHPHLRLLPPPRHASRLTVVLDLDETLIRMREGPFYVRPHAKLLFETLKAIGNIEIIIWTCATERYARRALEQIPSATWHHIVSRDPRWYKDGSPAVKNLRWLGRDLDRCVAIDNCPVAVSSNPDNCIVVQDIPECLPGVDHTLRLVALSISHILMHGGTVQEGLATCPYVTTEIFSITEDDDEEEEESSSAAAAADEDDVGETSEDPTTSEGATTPTCFGSITSPNASDPGMFPGPVQSPRHRRDKRSPSLKEPDFFVARALNYVVPGTIPTFGGREPPADRERLAELASKQSPRGGRRGRPRRG